MIKEKKIISLMLIFFAAFAATLFPSYQGHADGKISHVHMLHVDGAHGQAFKALMEQHQLPYFESLLSRGKISYQATTVDKSETMKVVPAYQSSQTDQETVAWWQFERDPENKKMAYDNTWIEPLGVIRYALGLKGPLYPTIFDLITDPHYEANEQFGGARKAQSGFAMVRRWVDFDDYSRNYMEGIEGAFQHKYAAQLHSTVQGVLDLYSKGFKGQDRKDQKFPVIMHSLMAAADEYCHLYGVTSDKISLDDVNREDRTATYCLSKGEHNKIFDDFFTWQEKEQTAAGHFMSYEEAKKKAHRNHTHLINFDQKQKQIFSFSEPEKLCFKLPLVPVESNIRKNNSYFKVIHPYYALGFIAVDIHLGKIINKLKSIKQDSEHKNDSLFDHTLFLIFGDHGMVDTKKFIAKFPEAAEAEIEYERDPESINMTVIEYLNRSLGLLTSKAEEALEVKAKEKGLYGIDDKQLPLEASSPETCIANFNPEAKNHVDVSTLFAQNFYKIIFGEISRKVRAKYSWLSFLRCVLVDPQLEKMRKSYEDKAIGYIRRLHLQGNPDYKKHEYEFLLNAYNQHIGLIYGGGALNNMELFLPHRDKEGNLDWSQRPNNQEILGAFGGKLMSTLNSMPAVELMFIRHNNEQLNNLPEEMFISVLDQQGNEGEIKVYRDSKSLELIFGYRLVKGHDPLRMKNISSNFRYGTYHQWMTESVDANYSRHNVVAGMGSYLYSKNPAIGDIILTHATDWNFGDNGGGHGGLHRDEKLTFMMMSGPDIKTKTQDEALKTLVPYQANPLTGEIEEKPFLSHPSLLDLAPTILKALGYREDELTRYAQSGAFAKHLQEWFDLQRDYEKGLIKEVTDKEFHTLNDVLESKAGISIDLAKFRSELDELLSFLPKTYPKLPDYQQSKQMGFVLYVPRS